MKSTDSGAAITRNQEFRFIFNPIHGFLSGERNNAPAYIYGTYSGT